jgi:uncharacterized protein (DUF58 family)
VDELLRRGRWPVLRRLGLHPGGDEGSRLRGVGIEYTDVREYQAGDDPRTIEWNITARSDRPYVRESTPDRGIDAWLLIDLTRSLDWGTALCLKRQLALHAATIVGQLLIGHGNRVGTLLFDEQVRTITKPAAGRNAFLQMLARIEKAQPGEAIAAPGPVNKGAKSKNRTREGLGLKEILSQVPRIVRRPSLIVLITDFLTADGWQRPLQLLAMRHEVVAVWITDPREHEIPDIGVVTFEDPESGRQITVNTADRRLRARFKEAAQAQRTAIRFDLRHARVPVAELSTGRDLLPQLLEFMKRRDLERRHRAALAPV